MCSWSGWEQDPCIFDLGNWILRTALTDVQKLREETEGFFVNVNVAAAQLERREFRSAVMNILKETGAKPEELCLELTERCRDLDIHFLRGEVEFFHSQGIKIALDDFGTGFSSLSYLKKLPINTLKIDKSFTDTLLTDSATRIITESIVSMVKSLGFESIAEGVEEEQQYKYLRVIGCDIIQGYLFGKPLSQEEIEQLLQKMY